MGVGAGVGDGVGAGVGAGVGDGVGAAVGANVGTPSAASGSASCTEIVYLDMSQPCSVNMLEMVVSKSGWSIVSDIARDSMKVFATSFTVKEVV